MVSSEAGIRTDGPEPRAIRALILARVAVVLILAYATAVWTSSLNETSYPMGISYGLAAFLLTALGLSAIYYALLEFTGRRSLQVLIQMVMDIFFVTWLLFETGDATSPYFPLYILVIGVSGAFLNANATLFISAYSGICYTILSVIMAQSFFFPLLVSEAPSRIVQIVAFNDVALLVVGLLAARLSERRRFKRELMEKAASFDNLSELHERILESVDSGIITTDLEGRIHGFNRAAEQITGSRAEEVRGRSIFELFGDAIRPSVSLALEPADDEGFSIRHFEAAVISRNGDQLSAPRTAVICTPAPLTTKAGDRYGMIISFQDISKMRSMEETLRRSDRLAAVGRMSAGLAHEIRNPLGSMGSALQYLQDKVERGSKEETLLAVVLKESERLNKIITDFLSYARPKDSGREKIDIVESIENTLTLLKLDPQMTKDHRIEFNRPDTAVFVTAEDEKMRQVFWNLIRNSLQAMPDGGTILVTVEELKGVQVRIAIEDNGVGMSPEQMEHLFEPFSGASHGTGLGMPIAHRIVLDHGGKLDVFSEPEKGTKVIIELPQ